MSAIVTISLICDRARHSYAGATGLIIGFSTLIDAAPVNLVVSRYLVGFMELKKIPGEGLGGPFKGERG